MAVDKNKVIAEATKLVQKGQFDKAIRAYEKILGEDGRDVRVLLKVGELQQKKGDSASAAETFSKVADAYSEQGFFLKAVAVYKQMMKLAPDDVRVNERLASLYQQLGILSDAMAQLQLVATAAEKAGDEAKQLDVLRRMVELDPENVPSSVKLGELYARRSETKLALDHLRRAAEQLKKNNRGDEYVKVAERIAFLAPNEIALTRELANIYLAKGDTKRALAKLQLCFKADPKDLETLTLLAQAFKDLGQASKTVSVYRELAHLYAEKGRADDARATWRRLLELAPGDAEAAQQVAPPRSPPSPAAPQPRAPAPAGPPQRAAVPPPIRPPAVAPAPAAPARAPSASAAPAPEAVAKLLTETDVYVKYGLHEKALEHLKKVLAIDPDHLEAHERALQLRALRNDRKGAAEEAVQAARIALARGLQDRARLAMDRLREIAPDHPELAALSRGAQAPPEEEVLVLDADEDLVLEVEPPSLDGEDEVAIAAAREPHEELVEEDAPLASPGASARPGSPALRAVRPAEAAPPSPPRPTVVAPPPPPVLVSPPPAATLVPPRAAPPAPEAADEEEDLDDELAEADFFIQQGLYDEAREALTNLLAFYPSHGKLRAKLADVERKLAPPPPAPPPPVAAPAQDVPPPPAGEETFDIARELAEELGTSASAPAMADEFQYSVADVFDQFKKGVAETVKAEDSETHYDLGIAYKEMGLLDDALHEFEVAMSGRARRKEIDCLTMIAVCRTEKGDPAGAVQAYQRALRSDYLTLEAARAVHYEIALAYEKAGEPEVALHYLHKVVKADPGYRDAKAVVARLGGGPGKPPAAANPRPAQGDAPASAPSRNGPKKNIGFV
jgi:pentatricopeptide repeat protein